MKTCDLMNVQGSKTPHLRDQVFLYHLYSLFLPTSPLPLPCNVDVNFYHFVAWKMFLFNSCKHVLSIDKERYNYLLKAFVIEKRKVKIQEKENRKIIICITFMHIHSYITKHLHLPLQTKSLLLYNRIFLCYPYRKNFSKNYTIQSNYLTR